MTARVGASPEDTARIRDEVVLLNLGLASAAARRYGFSTDPDDAVQVARTGLVEAFDRFDPTRGAGYAQFAWSTMAGLLRRNLRDHGWTVRPPRALQESANVVRQARPIVAQRLGRDPSVADLADHLGWPRARVEAAHVAEGGLCGASLDDPAVDPAVTAQQVNWDLVDSRFALAGALDTLTATERELVQLRFGDELTQSQIGLRLGTSQMQVSRLLRAVMAKLRLVLDDAAA